MSAIRSPALPVLSMVLATGLLACSPGSDAAAREGAPEEAGAPDAPGGRDFEGVVHQRMVHVWGDAVAEVVDAGADSARTVDRLLDASLEALAGAAGPAGAPNFDYTLVMTVRDGTIRTEGLNPFGEDGPPVSYLLTGRDGTQTYVVEDGRYYAVAEPGELMRTFREMWAEAGVGGVQEEEADAEIPPPPDAQPVNRTREVQGQRTEGYRATEGSQLAYGWVAPDRSGAGATLRAFQQEQARAEGTAGLTRTVEGPAGAFWGEGLPVRIDLFDYGESGLRSYLRIVFTSIEPGEPDPALVRVPPDFEERPLREFLASAFGGP